MTPPRIAWYVHHHGQGHVARLLAIASHLDAHILCFSSLPRPENLPAHCSWTQLDRDDTFSNGARPSRADATANGALHWAPRLHRGHRRRFTSMALQLDRNPVSVFVVDVSVEVAVFARLLGIPTIIMTQPGTRDDEPHRLAFSLADKIIAPWPEDVVPEHLRGRPNVVYVGGVSRFDHRPVPAATTRSGVLVLGGGGGSGVTGASVDDAQRATPTERWSALGIARGTGTTWSSDPWPALVGAEIVVAWAGQNSVADIAAAGARAVIIPQARPFGEQMATALALQQAGLAVVEPTWPNATAWPGVLRRARSLQPEWSRWRTRGAAERCAAAILATATEGRS